MFSPVETYFEESFHRKADGLVVLSEALRQRAISLGVAAGKVRVIIPGVDLDRVRPGDRAAARQALGISSHTFLYGYAGKIFPRDAALLMEAHCKIAAGIADAAVVLIGHANYNSRTYMPGNVLLTGGNLSYATVLKWFAACDVLLLPLCDSIANRGRWPSKVAEYMAAERAVVATAVGDVARLFKDGRAGVLTEPNASAFADGILRVYADPQRDEMGRAGRKIAREQLLWSMQTDLVQNFLEHVYGEFHSACREHEYA
jgi:glycosyltransferase involved in cell wall biosynthesis